jgi:hypothetical protein
MIGALIHIVLNTALVVVLAVIATIVFVIACAKRRRNKEPLEGESYVSPSLIGV